MTDLIQSVKNMVVDTISNCTVELLGGEVGSTQKKNADGVPTGEVENFLRLHCEIPKKNGTLSRARFDVKIPAGKMTFKETDFDEKDLYVKFTNLEVSYLDSRNIYLRASDYEIFELEEEEL